MALALGPDSNLNKTPYKIASDYQMLVLRKGTTESLANR
jgi:hypothetical protein